MSINSLSKELKEYYEKTFASCIEFKLYLIKNFNFNIIHYIYCF